MPSHGRDLAVTFSLVFQPDGSAFGTFTAAGLISDAGSAEARFVVSPHDESTRTLTGEITLNGARGSLTWLLEGITYPPNATRSIGHGRAEVTSGTRDYQDLSCDVRLVTVADFLAATLGGALDGTTSSAISAQRPRGPSSNVRHGPTGADESATRSSKA